MLTLKVLLIGPSIHKSKGGIATVISNIINNKINNIEFKYIPSHVAGNYLDKFLIAIRSLLATWSEKNIDIFHIHVASKASFFRKSLFVLLGKLMKKQIILHVHSGYFDSFFIKSPVIVKKYIKFIFRSCDKVLVLSEHWKDIFCKSISDKNIVILHNGVVPADFKACYTQNKHVSKLLFMGKLVKTKGIYDLLEAANILVNEQQLTDLFFYIAGDGEKEEVQKLINQYNLYNNVRLIGWINEIEKLELLKQVDAVILPSYIEGLPMAIIEAMAAGKIIISTNVGGIPDLVEEGKNGFLVEPGDIMNLCQTILFVHSECNYLEDISRNNINKIEESFNLPKLNLKMFNLYYDLAKVKTTLN